MTPEEQVHVGQVSGVVLVQPVIPVRPEVRTEASEEEQKILERFKSLDKDAIMRPLSGEEETLIPTPKPAKDKKRKKISTSEDPDPKKKKAPESQLQGMKKKSSAQEKKIVELEARLASELAKAKSEAEKAKAEADAIVVVYRHDAEAAQVQEREATETTQIRAYWIAKLTKGQSRRETLEEIHTRGFDLTNEIIKARENEADAGALASSDDDDDAERKSGGD
ncbi:uncharacterized protein [Nicotiana tomentosiformis]|uniref:uncharacterized protein n=1 Tax=Nicotiana tomentosiformis TaxID=4098 RepID=UPI00388C6B42